MGMQKVYDLLNNYQPFFLRFKNGLISPDRSKNPVGGRLGFPTAGRL
jgi:hypothetical protein